VKDSFYEELERVFDKFSEWKFVWKCVTIQIFGSDSNKSKFDSGGN
jgi:hypothetical protein